MPSCGASSRGSPGTPARRTTPSPGRARPRAASRPRRTAPGSAAPWSRGLTAAEERRAVRELGPVRDVGDPGLEEPVLLEDLLGRLEQAGPGPLALAGTRRVARHIYTHGHRLRHARLPWSGSRTDRMYLAAAAKRQFVGGYEGTAPLARGSKEHRDLGDAASGERPATNGSLYSNPHVDARRAGMPTTPRLR
jgi:hypothetical protein